MAEPTGWVNYDGTTMTRIAGTYNLTGEDIVLPVLSITVPGTHTVVRRLATAGDDWVAFLGNLYVVRAGEIWLLPNAEAGTRTDFGAYP